jgi:cytochrome P450
MPFQRFVRRSADAVRFVQRLETGDDRVLVYDEVRAQGRIVGSELLPLWLTADYATANAILRDGRFTKLGAARESTIFRSSPLFGSMLFVDPPQHTRLRRLAAQAFTPAAIQRLEVAIEKAAHRLIDQMAAASTIDLMRDYAGPLPRLVIGEILGVAEEEIEPLARAGVVVGAALDGAISRASDEDVQRANAEVRSFFMRMIETRRDRPRDDLLQSLIEAHEEQDRLSHEELLAMCSLLLFAGYETTVNLIGNGTLLLLRYPQSLARLRANPQLVGNAVDEMLRLEPPIQFTGRVASEEVVVAGEHLPERSSVLVLLAGANRDPDVFANPHAFDLDRPNAGDHLAFASGIHFCLGARLARLEGEIAFRVLLERTADWELAGLAPFRPTTVLRGLEQLPMRLRVVG